MLTALTLAAAALTPDWRYLPRSEMLPGGGPVAVRSAALGEPVMVACQRDKGFIVISAGPSDARSARIRSQGMVLSADLVRADDGSSALSIYAGSPVMSGLLEERRGVFNRRMSLQVAYDDGRRSVIAPDPAVARVVRECRSLPSAFGG